MKCPKCNHEFEIENLQLKGMIKKAQKGKIVSRPPFGYSLKNSKLIPDENSKIVEKIFLEFRDKEVSLNKLSKKYNFSVNGLKKILTNFTYIGKIKFAKETHAAGHTPIISPILFNQVQDKLERKGIKRIN